MKTGTVKWFNAEKGYGFIKKDDDGTEIFVHFTAIKTPNVRSLQEGQKVSFEENEGPRGPQAINVEVE